MFNRKAKRIIRHKRVRAKVFGTSEKPRFCVFKSGKHIYAQLIDDEKGKTLVSVNTKELKAKKKNIDAAKEVGKMIASKASEKKIDTVVFDRSGYPYHGKIKAIAESAREGGLKF